ncbi:MAG: radical SAM protein [Ruminococcaceae bacterium]|nr:radical SAM protein [Oscillospiraceae bacterium]
MIITYSCDNSLYINVTNRCTNSCDFCVRDHGDELYGNLWLEREPEVNEIIAALDAALYECKYKEIVFCGYGEPTVRLYDIFEVCKHIRSVSSSLPIRMNTNGQANLIWGRDVTPDFKGLFDTVSISLNSPYADKYQQVCHSEFGIEAHYSLIDFAQKLKEYVPNVLFSVVKDSIPDEDIKKCQEIADKLGVNLRIREML